MDPFGTLSFGSEHSEFPVQLGVSVSSCHEGPVSFKTLTLFPRYLLSNNTGATLQFQECTQKGSPLHTESHHLLGPGESEGFYFRSPDHCLRVCEHPLWTAWSGPFSVVETDYVILELKAKEVRPNRLLFATIFTEGPTISISVQDYEQQPPYLLINELTTRILVTQNDCVYAVEPQERYSFVLNQPGAEKGILTLAIGPRDDPLPLDLSEISTKPRFQHLETSLGKILLVTQRAGEVTTLRVTQNLADLPPEKAPLKTLRAVLDLPSIGLSLINFFPEEVCHLTASNLVFELESSDREVQVQGKLLDFQIDNSLPGPSYSRLLHRHSAKSQEPTVQIVALIERGDPGQAEKGVLEFRQLTVVTQSLSVALDNRVVTELAAFGQGLSHFITKASQVSSKLQKTSLPLTSPRKYFLNHFGLASTKVFLTTKASPEVLEESGLLSLPLSPTSPAKSMVMSAFLSNLRGLPLTFSPLEMHQILLTRDAFFVIVVFSPIHFIPLHRRPLKFSTIVNRKSTSRSSLKGSSTFCLDPASVPTLFWKILTWRSPFSRMMRGSLWSPSSTKIQLPPTTQTT